MSITAIEPAPAKTAPLHLHENVFATPDTAGMLPTRVRHFPVALRHGTAPHGLRCRQPASEGSVPPRADKPPCPPATDFREKPAPGLGDESLERIPSLAAQAVSERLFPCTDDLLVPAQSVAAIVHAAAPAMLEVLAGARPAHQLARALSPGCMLKLEYHAQLGEAQRPDPDDCCYSNPRVLAMRITQIIPLVFEAAVVLRDMKKVRATALRIERWHGRWQVTALEIG